MLNSSYRVYDITVVGDKITFSDGTVFSSVTTSKHLENCSKCAVIAITLGHGVDTNIRHLQAVDIEQARQADISANILVEREVAKLAKTIAGNQTKRYSPGYGDLSLAVQPDMLRLAGVKGWLSVTDTNLLIPQKSITALVGLRNEITL